MKNGIVISIFLVCASIFFYWNNRKQEQSTTPTPESSSAQSGVAPEINNNQKAGAPAGPAAVQQVDNKALIAGMMGYWVVGSPLVKNEEKHHYQLSFQAVENPELHGGREIEGLIFSYLESNPSKQTLGKLEFDNVVDGSIVFKVLTKDIAKFYSDGYYNEETDNNIIRVNPTTGAITSESNYKEPLLTGTIKKIDPSSSIKSITGSWNGFRSADDKKIKLDFGSITDFVNDFGKAKINGGCTSESSFKIRAIDESIFLVTVGNASCELGSNVFKGVFKDGKLKTVNYRQFAEASEVEFAQD